MMGHPIIAIDGYSALMAAADSGYSNCLASLIKAGADVNKTSEDGATALMYAASKGIMSV